MLKFRLISNTQTLLILGALLLSACGANEPPLTPTLAFSADEIRTQAVGTFSSDLTATAFAAPTNTPVPTLTTAPTLAVPATSTGGIALGSTAPAATASCYGLTFVDDVTIEDNTPMTAGQTFTKTWLRTHDQVPGTPASNLHLQAVTLWAEQPIPCHPPLPQAP
jgi:hypothetical protein